MKSLNNTQHNSIRKWAYRHGA